MAAPNTARQRMARLRIADLFAHPKSVFVIHYACESFDPNATTGSPRVIAIALRNLGTGQTHSFSIHEEIELTACPPALAPLRMDQLEYRMLSNFYQFLATAKTARFAHWNMRDAKFGFEAIAHRFAIQGGEKRSVPGIELVDLAMTLGDIYGASNLPRPHFEKLAEKNGLGLTGFLSGRAEPDAFAAGNYRAVRDSVLAKVGLIAQILVLSNDNALKTNAGMYAMNVGKAREAVELFQNNPVKAWVGALGAAGVFGFTLFSRWLA